jgi:hypothetical protein
MKRIALLLLVGCVEEKGAITGPQSIAVEMLTPANPGDVNNRLMDSQRTVAVNLKALDAEGQIYTGFADPVRVYAQFLGTLTPDLNEMPIKTIQFASGVAQNQSFDLPSAFGATTVWFDNGTGLGPDYEFGPITGTSPTLWYRDPFVADLQRPADETLVNALSSTPLTDKQVRVGASRYGARGLMVVTSTFAQGYTVSDVQCATGLPNPSGPCTTGNYDHAMVFTFSAPRDQFGRSLAEGQVIEAFNGGLTEFNGLTEIGFPRTFIQIANPMVDPEAGLVDRSLMPAPVLFESHWFGALDNSTACKAPPVGTSTCTGRIHFERNEAGAIDIRGAKVCPIDDAPDGVYTRYKQWSIDPPDVPADSRPDDCGSSDVINLITAGTDFTTDPHTLVGQTLAKVVGIVRPVNIGTFNVWIVYPRGKADVQTN